MARYLGLAPYYDGLTENVDYRRRAAYFDQVIQRYRGGARLLLDAACGTGSLSVELARLGYEVIGVDQSPEMLAQAMAKQPEEGEPVLYLCQDLCRLDLYGTVEAAVCTLDSVNHFTDPQALRQAFGRIALFLEPGGVFAFDFNTPYKHRVLLGEEVYVYDTDGVYCVWQNHLQQDGVTVVMDLDFFIPQQKGLYRRESQQIVERAYTVEELERLAVDCGLQIAAVYGEDSFSPLQPEDARGVMVLLKK